MTSFKSDTTAAGGTDVVLDVAELRAGYCTAIIERICISGL